jgi:4-amino-4-deoxy-L-arabinose transferase-like glycosyltransferase
MLRRPAPALLALLGALLIAWFALLGARDLIEPDEGRYAEIPREMVASGDWITPRLDGFKYFEKPPLQYWLTAGAFVLFGAGNATARLWPALLGLAGAAAAGLLAVRLYGRPAGLATLLMLPSSFLYFLLGHTATLDMAVSVFLFAGVACLVLAQQGREDWPRARRWMWLGWAALAAATLTKGVIGVALPGGAVLLYSLWQRDWALWRRLELGRGLLILLALAAPWFIVVSLRNPGFAWFFFVREHVLRYVTTVEHRTQPAWFFVPVCLLGAVPWTGAWLRALLRPGFDWRSGAGGFCAERFLWVFAALVFVFFSAGSSKLAPYVLPLFPALAVLAGPHAAARGDRAALPVALLGAAGLLALAWLAPRAAAAHLPPEWHGWFRGWLVLAAALLAGAGVAAAGSRRLRAGALGGVAAAALLALLAFQALGVGLQALGPGFSSRALAQAIQAQGAPDADVFCVGGYYPQSLPFYLGRTIEPVMVTDELAMGIADEPGRWLPSLERFAERWQAEPQAFAVLDQASFLLARQRALPLRVLLAGPRLVVVSRR